MSVDQLDLPALNGAKPLRGRNEPARGGGVDGCMTIHLAKQQSDPAALLGGELKPPRFDAGKFVNLRDRRADAFAAHALGDRPGLIGLRCGMK